MCFYRKRVPSGCRYMAYNFTCGALTYLQNRLYGRAPWFSGYASVTASLGRGDIFHIVGSWCRLDSTSSQASQRTSICPHPDVCGPRRQQSEACKLLRVKDANVCSLCRVRLYEHGYWTEVYLLVPAQGLHPTTSVQNSQFPCVQPGYRRSF